MQRETRSFASRPGGDRPTCDKLRHAWTYADLRKIRCQYPSGPAFLEACLEEFALQVYTTEPFEPGEELLLELSYQGLTGKTMLRAIGREWHGARPRLRVRAGGVVVCTGSEQRKLQFLISVARGDTELMPRRRHVRLPLLVEVRWRLPRDRELRLGALSEVSEGGALLLTDPRPPTGDEIIIELTPPGSARPLEILAVVRNDGNPAGVGVEFLARDIGGVHRIREVIRRLVEQ
ncbi:MAG: PilZ domain-containing protein [Nannocystaceae bacterium]